MFQCVHHGRGYPTALLRPEDAMTNLTLVASRQATPPAQWAHDIRNLLATIGLHLDSVARSSAKLRRIDISVERAGAITAVRIADDGGGLPPRVAARLFRRPARDGAMHGHGLAIARELMERNGGTLACETSRKGTIFRLELAAFTSIRVAEGPVTRSLGQRAI